MQSTGNHKFSEVPKADIPRSLFDRSHGYKTTFDSDGIYPIFVDEVLPGDTFNVKATLFARMATLIKPIMDNVFMDTFWFFVPNRLTWKKWQKFQGEQDNPGDSIDFTVPQCVSDGISQNSLGDYMGLPTNQGATSVNAMPLRAYNLIYNEWFRDENLQDSITVDVNDGPDAEADYNQIQIRGKRHDYFTSCLPWPQKGDAVQIPLGDSAPVAGTGLVLGLADGTTEAGLYINAGSANGRGLANLRDTIGDTVGTAVSGTNSLLDSVGVGVTTDPLTSGLYADLSNATAANINSLREAFAIQKMLERDARGGTRYTEIIKAHFGVTSPDFRLQRSEYLGGSSVPIMVNPVQQTSRSDVDESPQGNLSAFATGTEKNSGFTKSFTEHGYIIGLVNIRADLSYQNGQDRLWNRKQREDYYMPVFAHLGEQEVLNKEIMAQGGIPADDEVFGYQERWAEYRYKPSKITGAFRSNYIGGTLDSWHLAQDFATLPTLNATFIQSDTDIPRVVATGSSEPEFLLDVFFNLKCARPMPVYSVPGKIDQF